MVPEVGGHVPGEPLELEDALVVLDEELEDAVVELDEAAVDELLALDDELPPVQFPFTHVIEAPHTCPQ
jgi:hypothetical protein